MDSLAEALRRATAAAPDTVAVVDGAERVTYLDPALTAAAQTPDGWFRTDTVPAA